MGNLPSRPDRRSYEYRVYCDLVCGLKSGESKKFLLPFVAEGRRIPRRYVNKVYNRWVKPRLAERMGQVSTLF